MKPTLIAKLEGLVERLTELEALLAEPEIMDDQGQFRALAKEHAEISPVVGTFERYQQTIEALENAEALALEDPELKTLAEEEAAAAREQLPGIEEELLRRLVPSDPADAANVYLEIRAGTGGDEAALFVGDLLRMYLRFAENCGWQSEIISANHAEIGGYKEVVSKLTGESVYSRLKFESGAHRVQRVPETESQGRIHTSACTVAVLPEVDEVTDIEINTGDLRIDTFRASGAGGQHVNKTDSAIRITHLPSGVVVECQEERSQHKNKAKAMSLLKAKLLTSERDKQISEQAQNRRDLVGSGDRSERIRTYNYREGRVTDHRINLTVYKLDEVMGGQLGHVVEPLLAEHQADLMAQLSDG
ncbi:MAG: peptide chain release factor 1 [Pseudomonadota bacterium]